MHFFDLINEDVFRPLTGINKKSYMDILNILWYRCKRSSTYSIEKSTAMDEVEAYFIGLGEGIELDEEDQGEEEESEGASPRALAGLFLRRLRKTGWLDEKDGDYEQEPLIAINHKLVPLIKSFEEVIYPQNNTYKGKFYKIYTILNDIKKQANPYETGLKEVSEDMDKLNQSLRQLAASIEDHIDNLTKGKSPQEILSFFEQYEERIVVGAYHRFKTNDNLFYYRESLQESLDMCESEMRDVLVKDYMEVENQSESQAVDAIKDLIKKIREDVLETEGIMRIIDDRHITYRTRAVQRARFLLLSDGSIKSKINGLLQYYTSLLRDKDDLYTRDDSMVNPIFQIYGQNYFAQDSLATPSQKRKPTEIDLMDIVADIEPEVFDRENQKIIDYVKNALTSKNVNDFARQLLAEKKSISAKSVVDQDGQALVKVIGLYTYSQAQDRVFDIISKDNYVQCGGVRFKEFIIEERKG